MSIRFTATCDDYEHHIFRCEDEFIAYLDTLWGPYGGPNSGSTKRIQHEVLRDPQPSSYPCIMISAGTRELYNGKDEIQNIFLYDIEIQEDDAVDDEELETA